MGSIYYTSEKEINMRTAYLLWGSTVDLVCFSYSQEDLYTFMHQCIYDDIPVLESSINDPQSPIDSFFPSHVHETYELVNYGSLEHPLMLPRYLHGNMVTNVVGDLAMFSSDFMLISECVLRYSYDNEALLSIIQDASIFAYLDELNHQGSMELELGVDLEDIVDIWAILDKCPQLWKRLVSKYLTF